MGQLVYIKLNTQNDNEIEVLNKALVEMNIDNVFITNQMNIDWVNDINNNPNSKQKHLAPITLEELQNMFKTWTEIGQLSFDVGFDRTSQEEAEKYANFIVKYKNEINYIKGGNELINRYTLSKDNIKTIQDLCIIPKEPEMLPVEERTKEINGGLLLCKSWSKEKFWVIFGKTNKDKPIFMKNKIYVEDIYNNLYKDKNNYAYMLIPLLPLGNNSIEFAYDVYQNAYELGLRECPNYFLPMVYGLDLVNYNSIVDDYKDWYNQDEIIERFEETFKVANTFYSNGFYQGFVWNDIDKCFKPTGTNNQTSKQLSYCSILTCLLRAITNKQTCADLLTRFTGKKYIKIEF